jgi:hypothetical protein
MSCPEDSMLETAPTASPQRTLDAIVEHTARLDAVRKADLDLGDQVLVTTRNSTYSIQVLQDGLFSVSGGWFDRQGLSPLQVGINGCTWGGRAIKLDIVAARGLHLEFGNQVVTSRIVEFEVIRCRKDIIN